jgi:polysaccharide deacetylase 2 family uncharacterized protein YibQ
MSKISHKMQRIKEATLLKLVLLRIKFSALWGKIKENEQVKKVTDSPAVKKATSQAKQRLPFLNSPKIKIYLWQGLAALSLLYFISGIIGITSHYGEKAETAIEDGKRVIIELPFGEINARKKSLKRKSRKEIAQEEALKEEGEAMLLPEEDSIDDLGEEEISNMEEGTKEATAPSKSVNYDIKDIRPKVVIIISSAGLSRVTTENVLSLPAEVAISFSPYAYGVGEWTTKAADLGYELLMDLPFEPSNYPDSDPGPLGLLSQSDDDLNVAQINKILNMSEERLIGVVAPVEERFTANEEKIIPVLQELKRKKLTLFYTNQPRNYFLPQTAKKLGLPLIAYDVLVDENLSHGGIEKSIKRAERIAGEKGFVVIEARPYPITVEHLHKWLKTFEEKGLLLIPISDIL